MHPTAPEKSTPSHLNGHSNGATSNGRGYSSDPKYDMNAPSTIRQRFLSAPSDLGVVLVGFSGGQCKEGVDAAPTALVGAGLLDQISDELGYKLHGDTKVHNFNEMRMVDDEPHRGMKNPRSVSAVTEKLAEQVYEQAKEGRMVLTLGGDHSIAIGTIAPAITKASVGSHAPKRSRKARTRAGSAMPETASPAPNSRPDVSASATCLIASLPGASRQPLQSRWP